MGLVVKLAHSVRQTSMYLLNGRGLTFIYSVSLDSVSTVQ